MTVCVSRPLASCRIERASRAGLIGLAVADLLCCTAALVVAYGRRGVSLGYRSVVYSEREQVRVLTSVYGPFVQNACVKSNVWLTVVVAVGRYSVGPQNSLPMSWSTKFSSRPSRDLKFCALSALLFASDTVADA